MLQVMLLHTITHSQKVEVVGYDSNSGDIKINKLQFEKNALYFFRNYFIKDFIWMKNF